ncbi:MAG: protein-disulfide reductase DsbD domain-containing protein [Pseudomonadota bacterium]
MRNQTLAIMVALASTTATAQVPEVPATLDILSGWREADGRHVAALHIQMAKGWKTYWRVPGEGGIPPRFDWSRSRNLSGVAVSWPVPSVFNDYGLRSIGYVDEVVLPIVILPKNGADEIAFQTTIEIGVCEEVCIPVTLSAAATLTAQSVARDPAISSAIADRPIGETAAGVRSVECAIEPISDGLKLTATVKMPRLGRDEETVIELGDPNVWVSRPIHTRQRGTLTTTSELVAPSGQPFSLDRSDVRITILSPGQAVDIQGCG